MDEITKERLRQAMEYCEEHDMSVPAMIQFMQDYAEVDYDTVLFYLKRYGGYGQEE